MHTYDRILIIRFSSLGDIVLSSLLVRVLRQRFPRSQIDYLTKAEFGDLLAGNPNLTRVLPYRKEGPDGRLRELRRRTRESRYDLIVDIHDSLRSRYICAGARQVVRINKRKLPRFLLVKFKMDLYSSFGGAPSVALRYIEPLESLGVADDGNGLELFVPVSVEEKVNRFARASGLDASVPTVGICPSAKHGNKMWPAERFAETAALLARELGAKIVLFGWNGQEATLCGQIGQLIREMAPGTGVTNTAGTLSLTETASLMDHCAVVLSNDSGLMHIAAARKRKVVAIFGPTVQAFGFFPFRTPHIVVQNASLRCRPCTHIGLPECPKHHFKCMIDLPVTRVVDAAKTLLQQ